MTCDGPPRARRGLELRGLAGRTGVAVLVEGDRLTAIGDPGELERRASQAPARALIEAGAAPALDSDFNPGTSPICDFPQGSRSP